MSEKLYSKSHEWVLFSGETTAKIGISNFAQKELGDLVFVNMPEVGSTVNAGAALADVESVKAVSDVYSPVTGTVKAVNTDLLDHPELINKDAENAWFVEIENICAKEKLMTKAEYDAYTAK